MSREVRRVPADWQHPSSPTVSVYRGEQRYRPEFAPLYAEDMDDLIGGRERTHWQMYETTSEGTPISPPMPSPEALAWWLTEHSATVFGSMTPTYDEWLKMIRGSGATVGAIIRPGGKLEPGWLD